MPPKLIELQEAANLLGVTPERLNEMRSNSEIFGYRDGTSWKFKHQELERVADELGVTLGDAGPRSDDSIAALFANEVETPSADDASVDNASVDNASVDDASADDVESLLVTDEARPTNTVIGQDEQAGASDITLAGDQPNPLAAESDLELTPDAGSPAPAASEEEELSLEREPKGDSDIGLGGEDSGLQLSGDSDLQLSGDSDLQLSGDSDLQLSSESSDLGLAGDSDVLGGGSDLAGGSAGDTGNMGSALGADFDVADGLDFGEDLAVMDDDSSVIELSTNDEEIILEGSSGAGGSDIGVGSDIGLGAGDSGINLTSPTDSGIDLEDASADILSGSDSNSPELSLDDEAFPADDDFRLTPVGDLDNDESDSGSQVIAIEDGTFLGAGDDLEGIDDLGEGAFQEIDAEPIDIAAGPAEIDVSGAVETAPVEPQGYIPRETPYGVGQIIALGSACFLLMITGALMMDLVRNIWSFDKPYSATSSLMTAIISVLGW